MADEIPAKTSAADASDELTAKLLRAIATEITQRIAPELKTADALERANFTRLIAENLASDIDVLPQSAASLLATLRQSIGVALALSNKAAPSAELAKCASELAAIPVQHGTATRYEFVALRELAARVLRQLADSESAADSMTELGRHDAQWLMGYDAATKARAAKDAARGGSNSPDAVEQVTVESVSTYLRRRFPGNANIAATAVVPIPGGRSKKTFFASLINAAPLPGDVVIRQDYALKYAGTRVADEYAPLVTLSELGLPVPRPLHLESSTSEIGPPFILVNRLSGKPPGSYFGMSTPCPGAFRELARMLAKLHQVPLSSLGLGNDSASGDKLRDLIERYRDKWRDNATRASPVVEFAYAWALRECARAPGVTSFVHGDAGPYNLLVENDELRAILDWEFAHVGDTAEDLGVARIYVETCLPWEEFMQIYQNAGGQAVSASRVQLGMLTQFLKGTTLVAASGRNFKEGGTSEFIKGANAFTGLRLIELRIAELLKRFGAV